MDEEIARTGRASASGSSPWGNTVAGEPEISGKRRSEHSRRRRDLRILEPGEPSVIKEREMLLFPHQIFDFAPAPPILS